MLLAVVVASMAGRAATHQLGGLKSCWAAEGQQGDRQVQPRLVGQWQHHNLRPFLRLCDRSQARTPTTPGAALELEWRKVRAQQQVVELEWRKVRAQQQVVVVVAESAVVPGPLVMATRGGLEETR